MRSRAARLILVMLFVAATGVTAYLFWSSGARARDEAAQARVFDAAARDVSRIILDVRNAQQAYVAAGQGEALWSRRVGDGLARGRQALAALRQSASSPQIQSEIDATTSLIQDFAQLDRRIAGFARGGQNLMAADLIFADGHDLTEATLASLEQARSSEVLARDTAAATYNRRQVFAVASAAAAALLVALLLVPIPEPVRMERAIRTQTAPSAAPRPQPAELELHGEAWSPLRRSTERPHDVEAPPEPAGEAPPPAVAETPAVPPAAPVAAAPVEPSVPQTDFANVAMLCMDLARVVDTRALPGLLERAATVLDASGIILWIADPDGRELNPIFAQGYPPQLINRLGTIPRDAQNATAAAFRTSLVQTVRTDAISNGAIAAPLVTAAGCVGVMAAEVRNEREREDAALAAAAIVAAQLATLVGPPSVRSNGRAETAGAAASVP